LRGETPVFVGFYLSVLLLALYSSLQFQISITKSFTLLAILTAIAALTFFAMRKAENVPFGARTKVAAFLYLFGFFWLILSGTVLILVAIFFDATRPEMRRLLIMTGLSGIVMLTVSGSILLTAWKIWNLPANLRK